MKKGTGERGEDKRRRAGGGEEKKWGRRGSGQESEGDVEGRWKRGSTKKI